MRYIAVFLCLAFPTAGFSLSCIPYNAVSAFLDAAKSDEDYVAVLGRLTFDESDLPVVNMQDQSKTPPLTTITGRIIGDSLSKSGFRTPFDRDIQILVRCMGPWCSVLESGAEYLAFLERKDGLYTLDTNPCGRFAFPKPDRKTIRKITACMQGKRCDPELPLH